MDISEDMQTEVDDILERYRRKMLQFLRIFRTENTGRGLENLEARDIIEDILKSGKVITIQ